MKKLSNDPKNSHSAHLMGGSSGSVIKRIVLFDIDYTLFDTNLFRRRLYPLLAKKIGTSYDEKFTVLTTQAEDECKKTLGHFDPKIFLVHLTNELKRSIAIEELEKVFWGNKIISDCLYKETKDVFEKLVDIKNVSIAIFSTGEVRFQTQKFLLVKKYLEKKNIFIFANKQKKISEIIKGYQGKLIFLVDDSSQILYDAKSVNRNIVTILMRRDSKQEKSGDKLFVPDWEISSLRQLIPIVGRV